MSAFPSSIHAPFPYCIATVVLAKRTQINHEKFWPPNLPPVNHASKCTSDLRPLWNVQHIPNTSRYHIFDTIKLQFNRNCTATPRHGLHTYSIQFARSLVQTQSWSITPGRTFNPPPVWIHDFWTMYSRTMRQNIPSESHTRMHTHVRTITREHAHTKTHTHKDVRVHTHTHTDTRTDRHSVFMHASIHEHRFACCIHIWWRRHVECFIVTEHVLQKSPTIYG